jgi:hypothetical protein
MSEKLPKDVAFSILSDDMAFQELERQADVVQHRKITVMNMREFIEEKLSVMIRSVTQM